MVLYPLSVDVLYDGMMVDYAIYYYHQGDPLLLCENVVLTESMIESIRSTMRRGTNVYMHKEDHDRVLRETAYFEITQRRIEQKIGYDILKNIAKDFVTTACRTGIVPTDDVDNLAADVQRRLSLFGSALVMQCLNGIRGADEYLYVHCLNVGFLNGMMASWCGLDTRTCCSLIKAGLLHDLGKLKISPEILNKPGRLTSLEYEAVKRHPRFGHNILVDSGVTDPVILDAVLHHHERINGTGYPDKLASDELSIGARITAISDVYDAMIAERPYKGASTPFVILQEMVETSFSDLDTKLVKILLENMTTELLGRKVLLSNGAVAKVEFIDSRQPIYPMVSIDGEIIKTTPDVYCVRMYPM